MALNNNFGTRAYDTTLHSKETDEFMNRISIKRNKTKKPDINRAP